MLNTFHDLDLNFETKLINVLKENETLRGFQIFFIFQFLTLSHRFNLYHSQTA